MRRILALAVGAATGALAAVTVVRHLRGRAKGPGPPGAPDPRAEELRRKLAEAREAAADDDDLEADGTPGETLVEERTTREDNPVVGAGDDVDEARRRIHDEGRTAAEDMRRGGEAAAN